MNLRSVKYLKAVTVVAAFIALMNQYSCESQNFKKTLSSEKNFRVTSESIARGNLNSQIRSALKILNIKPNSPRILKKAFSLLGQRIQFYGSYDDFDTQKKIINAFETSLEADKKNNKDLVFLKAKFFASIHQFDHALKLLDNKILNQESISVKNLKSTCFLALHKNLQWVESFRKDAVESKPSYQSYTDYAAIKAVMGEYDDADHLYEKSLNEYPHSSPYPVAWVYFQRGLMWGEQAGKPQKAKYFYEKALKHLPNYVVANIHFTELLDKPKLQQEKLLNLLKISQDPELYFTLSEISENKNEKKKFLMKADQAYQKFLKKYPEAFWDHASELYLSMPSKKKLAEEYIFKNLDLRKTDRAYLLALNYSVEHNQYKKTCELIKDVKSRKHVVYDLSVHIQKHNKKCSAGT